jgi:hypothetical protein
MQHARCEAMRLLMSLLINHTILIKKLHNIRKIWPQLYVYIYVNEQMDLMAHGMNGYWTCRKTNFTFIYLWYFNNVVSSDKQYRKECGKKQLWPT